MLPLSAQTISIWFAGLIYPELSRMTEPVVDVCHQMYEGSFVCLDVLNSALADFGFRQNKSIFVDG